MLIAPPQLFLGVDEAFLPVAGFRCATGQMRASDAIPEAHLDVQTPSYTMQYQSVVINFYRVTMKSAQRLVSGIARSHEPNVASAAHPSEQSGLR